MSRPRSCRLRISRAPRAERSSSWRCATWCTAGRRRISRRSPIPRRSSTSGTAPSYWSSAKESIEVLSLELAPPLENRAIHVHDHCSRLPQLKVPRLALKDDMDVHRIGFRKVVERIRRCEERDEIAVHELTIHPRDIARCKFGGVKLVEMHC